MSELNRRQMQGAGLIASIAAAAVGAVALGFELERQVVGRRIRRREIDAAPLFELASPARQVTTTDGIDLHVEIDEPDSDVPADRATVVFVHGYVLNLHCFHFQRKALRGRRRLILYDQRSHGRSDRSDPEHCRVSQLGEDLQRVLAETTEPGERIILIGHSMGGMTIMDYASRFPEEFEQKVAGVGLIATSSGDLSKHSIVPGISGNVFSALAPGLLVVLSRAPQAVERTRRFGSDIAHVMTKRFAYGSDSSPELVEFLAQMIAQTPLEVIADFYPAFAAFDGRAGLERIQQVESMVIGGARDVILPLAHTDRVIERLPAADSWIDPDGGHMVMLGHAEECNAMIDKLVERAERDIARV